MTPLVPSLFIILCTPSSPSLGSKQLLILVYGGTTCLHQIVELKKKITIFSLQTSKNDGTISIL